MAYHRHHGVDVRIVRIFNTFGPRMQLDDGRAIPNFFRQALRGEDVTLFGDGSQTRSFCYVDDLVEGILRLLRSDYVGPVNIGNPQEMSLREMAENIVELCGSPSSSCTARCRRTTRRCGGPTSRSRSACSGWEPRSRWTRASRGRSPTSASELARTASGP